MPHTISKDEWLPQGGIELEEPAWEALRSSGNVLVTAGPGSGKTELLAQKACYLLQTGICPQPFRILAISFKEDSASNIRERVRLRCGEELSRRFSSFTFDGFAKMVLDRFRYALPVPCRPSCNYQVHNMDAVQSILGCGKKKIEAFDKNARLTSETSVDERRWWRQLVEAEGWPSSQLTFGMVFALALYIVEHNPNVRDAIRCTYRHVFVDEFQDTTGRQYSLLRALYADSGIAVTAVGDNKQRIMVWAGALLDAFERFRTDFSPTDRQLLMNHRSAPRLVRLQNAMYKSLGAAGFAEADKARWLPEDGAVKLFLSQSDDAESTAVASDIAEKMKGGVKPEEICILAKQKVGDYTRILSTSLAERGIRCRLEDNCQEVLSDGFLSFVVDCLDSSTSRSASARIRADQTAEELLCPDPENDYLEFQTSFTTLLDDIRRIVDAGITKDGIKIVSKVVESFVGTEAIANAYPSYRQEGRFDKQVDLLADLIVEESRYAEGLHEALCSLRGDGVIPMMTIHKSKGLEYEYVYFIGLDDEAFWTFRNRPEEDRCAFFVALSRARQGVIFTFSQSRLNVRRAHSTINEFYELLYRCGYAEVVTV